MGAEVASSHIFSDKSVHSRPPVVARDQVLGMPATGVASNGRIMVKFEDFESKGDFLGNIDFSLIKNQSVFF